jgi:hypothetical protein
MPHDNIYDPKSLYTDICEITSVCYDYTALRIRNAQDNHPGAYLFVLSCRYVELTKPKYVFSEMTPMHEGAHVQYYEVVETLKRIGYIPSVCDRAPSSFTDATSRDRWLCFAKADDLPSRRWQYNLLDLLSNSDLRVSAASEVLLPAGEVPDDLWEHRAVTAQGGGGGGGQIQLFAVQLPRSACHRQVLTPYSRFTLGAYPTVLRQSPIVHWLTGLDHANSHYSLDSPSLFPL